MQNQSLGSWQIIGDIGQGIDDHGAVGSRLGNSAEIDCPACHAAVSPLATVCRHCNANVTDFRATVERARLRRLTMRVACLGAAGAAAGLLACFHGADLLPSWLTTVSAYLGAAGAALAAMSLAARP